MSDIWVDKVFGANLLRFIGVIHAYGMLKAKCIQIETLEIRHTKF